MFELPKRLCKGMVWLTTKDHRVTMKTVVSVEKGSSFKNQRDAGYCNVDAETVGQIMKADFVIRD
jgi:hypothetical protein